MFRYVVTRRGAAPAAHGVDVARLMDLIRAAGLACILVAVAFARPHPGEEGSRGLAIAVALAVSAAGWVVWMLAGPRRRLMAAALIVMAGAGGALTGLSPRSPAIAFSGMVAFSAGAHLSAEISVGVTAETLAAFLAAALAIGAPPGYLIAYSVAFAGLWTLGLTRRAYLLRARQAEQLLAETRRAHQAEARAAALAERARIAREIHDVLADSLAAVSVNLQAAEALLGGGTPPSSPDLAKAIACVTRAGALTREGMAAARRAVLALRDDGSSLTQQLSSLAGQYRAAGDLTVDFRVTGEERPLPAEAGQAAYRTAQEALTNARKHASGQPVQLALGFEPGRITVSVVNPLPPESAAGQLAATGAGYGLTGLRERAALAGGALDAGPADGNWRVRLRIPA